MHATVRSLIEAAPDPPGEVCVIDIEASLEHFAQNKAIHADTMLIVVEPYFRSLESGRRMIGLARQLDPDRLALVANKVRGEDDLAPVRELATGHGLELAAAVPYDERLLDAERADSAPLDFDPAAPAVAAIDELARRLVPDRANGAAAGKGDAEPR
ncbi:MAG: hypothetical protein M3N16_01375 [Actinomycetota bacterium]|nr:hypothetical protein [Actinomycetota bacterium]